MYFQYLKGMSALMYLPLGFRKYMIWPLVLMIFSDRSTFVSGIWFCLFKWVASRNSITPSILKLGWRFWNGSINSNVKVSHLKISIIALKLRKLLNFLTLKTHISLTVPKDRRCLLKIEKIKKMLEKVIFFA